ncbi:MAG: DUF1501 domain-containing protein, partial [Lentisphaeraceae bacterium]|nr:DUF1501 domain-containing protein [Lentisphaeraceae bacterium]
MNNFSRRDLFKFTSAGLATYTMGGIQVSAADAIGTGQPHFKQRAKRVIFLNMRGAPSHVDTFDYKPKLYKANGKSGKYGGQLLASPWKFNKCGRSGLRISELFPNLGKQADHLCLLHGMHSAQPNHPQAQTLMHTGNFQFARPSLGAWILYGLGSENKNIPGFITLGPASGTSQHYGSAFLPTQYQGTVIGKMSRGGRGSDDANLPDIANKFISKKLQRKQLDFIQSLNKGKLRRDRYNPDVKGIIEANEMAYRMQDSMPAIMDYNKEKESIKKLYGLDQTETATFGKQCLLARRFVEAGARFIEVTHGSWDHHFNMKADLTARTKEIDRPIAGLLSDLKRRGLLKDTLDTWSGEFGRTPDSPNRDGRDHNNKG